MIAVKAAPLNSSQNLGKIDGNSGSPKWQQKPAFEALAGIAYCQKIIKTFQCENNRMLIKNNSLNSRQAIQGLV